MSTRDMINYLNHHLEDDVQTRMIHFLFTNYRTIHAMNIIEMSQRCFVSPASISRLARNFGYASFDKMKTSIAREMSVPEPRFTYRMNRQSLQELRTQPANFYQRFAKEITDAIADTATTVPYESIDNLLQQIIDAKQVTIFGYDIMLNALTTFQSAMLNVGIVVSLGDSPEIQESLASQLAPNSLAIVFSSFGTFFAKLPHVYDAIVQSDAHTVLVTQMSGGNIYASAFDEILSISSSSNAEAGSYPMDFLLDYMARRMFVLRNR